MAAGDILLPTCAGGCTCATCTTVGVNYTSGGGGHVWTLNGVPQVALVGPTGCPVKLTVSGPKVTSPSTYTSPGVIVFNTVSFHNFSAFTWTYTVTYDGTNILTESGSFAGGSSDPGQGDAYLVFTTGTWYLTGIAPNQAWNWDYTGTVSGNLNPPVHTTLTLSGPDNILSPNIPGWVYYSQ